MREMLRFREKRMLKKIIIIVSLIFVIALGLLLWSAKRSEKKQNITQAESLFEKKQELEQKIAELDRDYKESKNSKATTQIVFTELKTDVYDSCYPIMKNFQYTGVLAISLTQFPGMDGLLSVKQFEELIQEGWSVCIKWDTDSEVNEWWPELKEKTKKLGIDALDVAYFTNGAYTSELDQQLNNMGVSVVIHHGEEKKAIVQKDFEEGIWHLGAVGISAQEANSRFSEALVKRGNITYLVGFELEDERYDESEFVSMLELFDTHDKDSTLLVSDIQTAREYYEKTHVDPLERAEEYQKKRKKLAAELVDVNAKLAEIKTD